MSLLLVLHCSTLLLWKSIGTLSKLKKNFKKHKVSFDEAVGVFFDALAQQFQDSHDDGNRMIIIGMGLRQRVLLVVFAEYYGDKITIISARLPEKNERKVYEEGI